MTRRTSTLRRTTRRPTTRSPQAWRSEGRGDGATSISVSSEPAPCRPFPAARGQQAEPIGIFNSRNILLVLKFRYRVTLETLEDARRVRPGARVGNGQAGQVRPGPRSTRKKCHD